MAERIGGVNVPDNKHTCISLTYIKGIGRPRALKVCQDANVPPHVKLSDLTPEQIEALRTEVGKYTIEGNLIREVSLNIKRKMDIGSYEGLRHRRGLPLKKRTKTNARTRKGPRKPIRG